MIIGLALGLADEYNTVAVLLAVFTVHQFLEGLCLGYLLSGLPSKVPLLPPLPNSGCRPHYSQVGVRYKSVNFRARRSPGSPSS